MLVTETATRGVNYHMRGVIAGYHMMKMQNQLIQARATFLWSLTSFGFDWALFRTINIDQRGGKTESERFQRLLAMTI